MHSSRQEIRGYIWFPWELHPDLFCVPSLIRDSLRENLVLLNRVRLLVNVGELKESWRDDDDENENALHSFCLMFVVSSLSESSFSCDVSSKLTFSPSLRPFIIISQCLLSSTCNPFSHLCELFTEELLQEPLQESVLLLQVRVSREKIVSSCRTRRPGFLRQSETLVLPHLDRNRAWLASQGNRKTLYEKMLSMICLYKLLHAFPFSYDVILWGYRKTCQEMMRNLKHLSPASLLQSLLHPLHSLVLHPSCQKSFLWKFLPESGLFTSCPWEEGM